MKLKTLVIEDYRNDFPIFSRIVRGKNLIYLDSAATSQKPKQVIDSINNFYSNYNANYYNTNYQQNYYPTYSNNRPLNYMPAYSNYNYGDYPPWYQKYWNSNNRGDYMMNSYRPMYYIGYSW